MTKPKTDKNIPSAALVWIRNKIVKGIPLNEVGNFVAVLDDVIQNDPPIQIDLDAFRKKYERYVK